MRGERRGGGTEGEGRTLVSITGDEKSNQSSVSRLTDEQARAIATSGMSQEPSSVYPRAYRPLDEQRSLFPAPAEYAAAIKAYRDTPEFARSRRNRKYLLAAFFGVLAITACLTFTLSVFVRASWRDWSPVLFSGLFIAICIAWFWVLARRNGMISGNLFRENYVAEARKKSPDQERPPDHWLTDPDLQNLIILNRTQIGVYQDIATGDAKRAARNSQIAMSFGFLILIAGAVLTIRVPNAASKIVVGVLASLGSVLSGYIGQTFMKAQDQAMNQLNYYFRQPLVNSYMLSAERLTQKLAGTSQQNALKDLIRNVLVAASRAEELDTDPPVRSHQKKKSSSIADSSTANNGPQPDS